MDIPSAEIKRKVFHNLSLIYMAMYAFLPRMVTLSLISLAVVIVGGVEFLRLRRPELNNWLLKRFGGIHRVSEVTQISGIFWTLLGCALTIFIFDSRRVVLPALGFLTFGDTASSIGGKKWGKHPWKWNPNKTMEGSVCFFVVSLAWALLFVRWKVAIPAALAGAAIEMLPMRLDDNFRIPVFSAPVLSVLSLVLKPGSAMLLEKLR